MKIANAQLWVQDQEEALKFWAEKVGFQVRSDVTMPEMGDFRWLCVGPAGQEDVSIVLMAVPGEPMIDPATQEQIRDLSAKGFAGTVFLTTEDCRADWEKLRAPTGSSSPKRRKSGPTASTPASAIRPVTRSG